jgi:hypothetical protein
MYEFEIHGRSSVNDSWDGQPTTLAQNENVVMPQTAAGTMILAATNKATQNNQGDLTYTSGGGAPGDLVLPALANQPSIVIKNWGANNLSLTNTSAATATPILVQAVGPGIPGITPVSFPIGQELTLSAGDVAAGNASPQYMQLVIRSNAATLGILGVIGGPQDNTGNNGYVIAVNAVENTGPGTGKTPPEGYYATTTGNTYTFSFNWGSSQVFVANLSPETANDLTVLMRKL